VRYQRGALPLLQRALLELWNKREGQRLTVKADWRTHHERFMLKIAPPMRSGQLPMSYKRRFETGGGNVEKLQQFLETKNLVGKIEKDFRQTRGSGNLGTVSVPFAKRLRTNGEARYSPPHDRRHLLRFLRSQRLQERETSQDVETQLVVVASVPGHTLQYGRMRRHFRSDFPKTGTLRFGFSGSIHLPEDRLKDRTLPPSSLF
jgi:hypothetical protein